MFPKVKTGPAEVDREAEVLAAVIDAQRAEQRNAESLLSRLREVRDGLVARGSQEARLEALDRDIAAVAGRVEQALRRQSELLMRSGPDPRRA